MAQRSPPRRALIVEDEVFFARLEADMRELGFDICDLAANGQQASTLAMNNQPDVVLMDINLEGGREGIEVARWLHNGVRRPYRLHHRICRPRYARAHPPKNSRSRCCQSRFIMAALPTR